MPAVNVYSTQLLNVANLHGTAAFVVPAGYVLDVRDVELFESSPGGALIELAGASGVVFAAFGPNLTTTYNNYSWRGRLIVNAGDQFEVNASLPANVCAMGYLLTLP